MTDQTPGLGHNVPPADARPPEQALLEVLTSTNRDMAARVAEIAAEIDALPTELTSAEEASKLADTKEVLASAIKELQRRHEDAKRPYLVASRVVDGYFNELVRKLSNFRAMVLNLADRWQDKLRREAAAKAAEEARLRREAAERQRQEAQRLAEQGEVDAAIAAQKGARRQEDKAERAAQVAEAPPSSAARVAGTYGGGIRSRTVWVFEITDKSKVPLEYLEPNEALIKAKVQSENKAQRLRDGETYDGTVLAGVKIFQKTSAI